MALVIRQYVLPRGRCALDMTKGAEVLSVRHVAESVRLIALEPAEGLTVRRHFRTISTGECFSFPPGNYVGSTGDFHVFERTEIVNA